MELTTTIAALFDLDGVVVNTEGQYTAFWHERGKKYLNEDDFGRRIKGQTLRQIFDRHFAGMTALQRQITEDVDRFESQMDYSFLPGLEDFVKDLRKNGVKTAIVTSSNNKKMEAVYKAHPHFKVYFDRILTADDFTRSKPDPECFLLGMKLLGAAPEHTLVFEDSFHGLQAGMSSGATVIGLATTNSRDDIGDKAHYVIDDFSEMTFRRMLQAMNHRKPGRISR